VTIRPEKPLKSSGPEFNEMNKVLVKICGITECEDAFRAVRLGAAALGFIFAPGPRQILPDKARRIIEALPPGVKTVGVFVNAQAAAIREHIIYCGLDLVQLHGQESPEFCRALMPYAIKAVRIKDDASLHAIAGYRTCVRALLLDTYSEDKAGGTGKTFDWQLAVKAKAPGLPIFLAGGLGPSNIQAVIRMVRPYAVDVNSGVEERPGKKSYGRMKELMEKVAETEKMNIEHRTSNIEF
jgi:phosphoribosylanthranilate isomerase